jgi:hypothetical protein
MSCSAAGYFQHDGNSIWQGSLGYADLSQCPPDMGPSRAQVKHGVMTVGAIPWIINFNVPLHTSDITKGAQPAKPRRSITGTDASDVIKQLRTWHSSACMC